MQTSSQKKIGIFLGRLQPQHPGHESMIEKIFQENDEVVLCVGSAQKIASDEIAFERNPLSIRKRLRTLRAFLSQRNFPKPYAIVTARDIEPDSAWPGYLRQRCRLKPGTINTVYFADDIPDDYRAGLQAAGFRTKFLKRKKFRYHADNRNHRLSSATEIRNLTQNIADL